MTDTTPMSMSRGSERLRDVNHDRPRPDAGSRAPAARTAERERQTGRSEPRVVIATILPPDGTTGVQTHVREVYDYLTSVGRDVTIVHPRSPGTALAAPVFAGRLPLEVMSHEAAVMWYRHWHWRFLRRALRKELAAGDDAVIYAQCPLAARAALDVRSVPNQRVVMALHFDGSQADEWVDKDLIRDGGRVYRRIRSLERVTIPYVDGIVSMSASALQSMRRYGLCIDPSSCQVVPNFTTAPEPVTPVRPAADLVTLGGLEIHKNHQYMLHVLAAANRMGRRYTLDIIGDGPTRRPLSHLARDLGLENQVRLLGRIPRGRASLPGHRAYVHAATREVFPFALIEAMAAGLPVIAGRTGGISEMVEHEAQGVFWPLDDPESAARVLVALLDDEPRRVELATAARARFAGNYDARVVGPVLDDFLATARQHHLDGEAGPPADRRGAEPPS